MRGIKGIVRDGRIETYEPIPYADGTVVFVRPLNETDLTPDDLDNSPEGIQAWLKAFDSLEPLVFTDEERKEIELDRQARRSWELEHFDERAEKLRKLWD